MDLGKKLSISGLLGIKLILSKGGLRILRLPLGIRVSTGGARLKAGGRIPFEQPVQLEDDKAESTGTITFSALAGVPVPLAYLSYLAGQPEQRRKLVLLIESTDMGQATGEQTFARLRFLPLAQGIQVSAPGPRNTD